MAEMIQSQTNMNPRQTPSIRMFIPIALLFGIVGWAGLVYLFIETTPYVGPRWLFFLFWFFALTGSALPIVAFLHRRFPASKLVPLEVITRQAVWVGFYGCILAWLQIGRVVTFSLALFLAAGFVLIEWFIRLREKSEWKP
jgi:hypothetical protein